MSKVFGLNNLSAGIVSYIFYRLNMNDVTIRDGRIITDTYPLHLIYPEGWGCINGVFRPISYIGYLTRGGIPMIRNDKASWRNVPCSQTWARQVPICDINDAYILAWLYLVINPERHIEMHQDSTGTIIIVCDDAPELLNHVEGMYVSKGCITNRNRTHSSTYTEIPMIKSDGTPWDENTFYDFC